jgi:pilus assembly protein CpaF
VGIARLDRLLAEPDITELMVNAGPVWVERAGRLERQPFDLDEADLSRLVDGLVGAAGSRVDRASPLADLRLPDGCRANIVVPPAAPDGPCVTIRRFALRRACLDDFAGPRVAAHLAAAVRERRNIVVVGGTGSGKTTLLNALAACIPATERVVTVEDTAELALAHPHVVRLEARRPNSDGAGELSVRRLVVNALRMRPDRILVGEVRGAEVLDMAQAMNSGHEGSLSTCHANSPRDAMARLEAMALLGGGDLPLSFVRHQLRRAVHLLVHVSRLPDGRRRVVAADEVVTPVLPCSGSDAITGGSQHDDLALRRLEHDELEHDELEQDELEQDELEQDEEVPGR